MANQLPIASQEALAEFINQEEVQHAIIEAVAGSGKTYTLCNFIVPAIPHDQSILYLAFNTQVQKDFKRALETRGLGDRVTVKTIHSFSYQSIDPQPEVSEFWKFRLIKSVLPMRRGNDSWKRARATVDLIQALQHSLVNWRVPQAVTQCRLANAIGDRLQNPERIEQDAMRLMEDLVNGRFEVCDFDDMLWLGSSQARNLPYAGDVYNWVLVDEAQDLSPDMIEAVMKCIAANEQTRMVIVGDDYQSIYQWRGAVNAIPSIRNFFQQQNYAFAEFCLPQCRRCPTSHLQLARMVYGPGAENPRYPLLDFLQEVGVVRAFEGPVASFLESIHPGDAVISERNKPVLKAAYFCVRSGKPAAIVSSSSLKNALLGYFNTRIADDLGALRAELAEEMQRQRAFDFSNGVKPTMDDFYESIEALINDFSDVPSIITFISETFRDVEDGNLDMMVRFATMHRIKGSTVNNVWLVGRKDANIVVSELPQEMRNLLYVALTRARNGLNLVNDPECQTTVPDFAQQH